jgi:hypothetical protein
MHIFELSKQFVAKKYHVNQYHRPFQNQFPCERHQYAKMHFSKVLNKNGPQRHKKPVKNPLWQVTKLLEVLFKIVKIGNFICQYCVYFFAISFYPKTIICVGANL